jgi:hypothetical protein
MRPHKGLYEYHIAVAAKKRLTKVKKPKEEEYSKNTQTSLKILLNLLLSPESMVATIAQ